MLPRRGSDDNYCSVFPSEGHYWGDHLVDAAPIRWIRICAFCNRIYQGDLREQLAKAALVDGTDAGAVDPSSGEGTKDRHPEKHDEGTLVRVAASLKKTFPCMRDSRISDAVSDMMNAGILFRERASEPVVRPAVITLQEFD